jgi:type III secretion system FlhB-like substrate exporter
MGQLKEILITKPEKIGEKKEGALQYKAFYLYELKGNTQSEVLTKIIPMAKKYGVEITESKVNNWLSRRDILKELCNHLIEEHINEVKEVLLPILYAQLSKEDRGVIKKYWLEGKSFTEITDEETREKTKILLNTTMNKMRSTEVKEKFFNQVKEKMSRRQRKKKGD